MHAIPTDAAAASDLVTVSLSPFVSDCIRALNVFTVSGAVAVAVQVIK